MPEVSLVPGVSDMPYEENTEVLQGIDKNIDAILRFINNSKYRYDVYTDSSGPSYVIKIESLKKSYVEFVKRGGRIRFITEITKQNISYCKELMKVVELRHIEGIRGFIRINENEYQSNLAVQESKLSSILVHSTLKDAVGLQQRVFDTLWKKAIPAKQLINEIEGVTDSFSSDVTPKQSLNKTMQLWTNQDQSQYAIKLEGKSDLLATTNQNSLYTNLVEESDYLEDYEYDWNYTLRHWIEKKKNDNDTIERKEDKNPPSRSENSKEKPSFKCQFCRLTFHTIVKRKQHEREWHSIKLQTYRDIR